MRNFGKFITDGTAPSGLCDGISSLQSDANVAEDVMNMYYRRSTNIAVAATITKMGKTS